jgi:hypothetical protein
MPSIAATKPMSEPHDQMTIREFLAFTGTRPDEERWELIEGVPVLNASPIDYHQAIAGKTSALDLTALDLSIPLADIYRYTPLGA